MEDSILIIEFNEGTTRAFTRIYERLYPGVYNFAKKFVVAEDAADITSETFFKLFKGKRKFESIDNIKAWLIICTRNACLNKLTSEKYKDIIYNEVAYRLSRENPDWLDQEEQVEIRRAYLELIFATIYDLPLQKQAIFQMAFIEGLKNPEIAKRLGVSERRIRNTKSRLLARLRDQLGGAAAFIIFCSQYL